MGYNEIILIEISCDFPGCEECLVFGNLVHLEEWDKIRKMVKAIGWTHISFPSKEKGYGNDTLMFCPVCKKKELPLKEKHDCVYVRKNKKGELSYYGSVLECYFCGMIKIDNKKVGE